ncbi:hypothetical protein PMI22_05432 [Pseudomonas sp. GM21]|nr:hypothetical protein PMI22_05432 [Pseudomonas sp. GM21]
MFIQRTITKQKRTSDIFCFFHCSLWCSHDPHFEETFWDVIGLYLDPPDKALVLCCDEKAKFRPLSAHSPDSLWESGISARNRTIMSAMVLPLTEN